MKRAILILAMLAFAPPIHACLNSCSYFVENDNGMNLRAFDACAFDTDDGNYELLDERFQELRFNEHGLATVLINGSHFYVKRDGRILRVLTYDNWADEYSGDLVRSVVRGKMAYFNRDFDEVIAPEYDWGWPFRDGLALVCKGCVVQRPDEHGYKPVAGGRWGYIDKKGSEVVPVMYEQDNVPLPANE